LQKGAQFRLRKLGGDLMEDTGVSGSIIFRWITNVCFYSIIRDTQQAAFKH